MDDFDTKSPDDLDAWFCQTLKMGHWRVIIHDLPKAYRNFNEHLPIR